MYIYCKLRYYVEMVKKFFVVIVPRHAVTVIAIQFFDDISPLSCTLVITNLQSHKPLLPYVNHHHQHTCTIVVYTIYISYSIYLAICQWQMEWFK